VVTHDEKIFNRFDHIYMLRDGAIEVPAREAAWTGLDPRQSSRPEWR